MAFENRMIASMNNPNAVEAWREASRQHHWKIFHADRAASLEDHAYTLNDNIKHYLGLLEQAQRELQASREENLAVHKDLGEVYEINESAMTLASSYLEAYFDEKTRACRAEETAFKRALLLFSVLALQSVGAWGYLLTWLS